MPALGSDALYLRALIALILEKGWEHKDYIEKYARDWDKAKAWFEGFDIDAALRVCKVSRKQTEEFARILTTRKWGMHQDLGLFFNRHSTVSSYLCLTLMIVCGMALVKGGNILPERALALDTVDEHDPKTWRLPVTGRFPVLGAYPEGAFPDEVLGSNPDRIRMCFSTLTNPARSYPDSQRCKGDPKPGVARRGLDDGSARLKRAISLRRVYHIFTHAILDAARRIISLELGVEPHVRGQSQLRQAYKGRVADERLHGFIYSHVNRPHFPR